MEKDCGSAGIQNKFEGTLFMKLRDILELSINEAKQVGDVYHATTIGIAVDIINQNHLRASNLRDNSPAIDDFGKSAQNNSNQNYKSISTSREKGFIPNHRKSGRGIVIFQLDGNALSNKYKVMPYDDNVEFDAMYRIYKDPDRVAQLGDEKEEMWYGDKINRDGGIEGIKKYIKN